MRTDPALDWPRLLAAVREEEPGLFRAWFETLKPRGPTQGRLEIYAADASQAHYLEDCCREVFTRAAMKVSGCLLTVRFVAGRPGDQVDPAPGQQVPLAAQRLLPDYTFEQFVVGPSNRLAHAACQAIIGQLGALYNPLFIHGASGVGKTHLLQATCAEVQRRYPHLRSAYTTCEAFVNDFVRALAGGGLQGFRAYTRQLHLLLIDDVQFLANRESSQEELFHTFNALYQAGQQIVLSADSLPAAIPTLEDRLASRFNWGLVAQIDPPDRETRQAILHKKARLRGMDLPNEIIDLLAEHSQSDIRLPEGALTKLISHAQLAGMPLTLETARTVLSSYEPLNPNRPRLADVLDAVCQHFGVRPQELLGRKRTRSLTRPRQIAMYLARQLTQLSLEEIGMHLGGRDHSTVLHATRTIEVQRASSHKLAAELTQLTQRLTRSP